MVSNVAITGISSKLARLITAELLQQPHVRIRGSSRDQSKLPDWMQEHNRIDLIRTGPFEKESLRALVSGCDVVICCYFADNNTMLEGQRLLIELCEEEKVRRYIASDYTVDIYTKLGRGEISLKEPMQILFEELQGNERVAGVHVLVGLLTETFVEAFTRLEKGERSVPYWGTGHEKFELTSYRTAAEYVAAVALDGEAVGILRFLGDSLSVLDIAAHEEATRGFKPALKCLGTIDDLRKIAYENEIGFPINTSLHCILTGKVTLGSKLDNKMYPQIKPQSFQEWLESRKGGVS